MVPTSSADVGCPLVLRRAGGGDGKLRGLARSELTLREMDCIGKEIIIINYVELN